MKKLTAPFIIIFGTLYLIMYIYAQIGMLMYGGMVTISLLQNNQAQIDQFYYLMNFNDFGCSLVTLFHILVVNNWYVTCSVYTYALS